MFPARDLPDTKLADIHDTLSVVEGSLSSVIEVADIKVHVAGEEHQNAVIAFPITKGSRKKTHKVPATQSALVEIANFCGIPTPFFTRQDADVKALLLNALLQKEGTSLIEVRYTNDAGLVALEDPKKKPIDLRAVVEIAARVLGEDALVVEWWKEPSEFRLDACALTDKVQGKGGSVGDITRNGLRFGQNLKTGQVPWVAGYFNRKVCTNGMEIEDSAGKFDGRGLSVDQVLAELEAAAELVFSRGPERIAAFYDLQNETIENPERFALRLAREQKIAPRFSEPMVAEHLPPILDPQTGHTTMFDLVNLITNQALNPSLTNKAGSRRKLEQAGGKIVTEHVQRCRACQSKLSN